jgi:hypothetical protein
MAPISEPYVSRKGKAGGVEYWCMPFGDTAKKVQRVTELAEKLYKRVNRIVEQVQALRERAEQTSEQIEAIDRELAEQRALVEAVAEAEGLDVEAIIEERVESAAGDEPAEGDTDEGQPAEEATQTAGGESDSAETAGASAEESDAESSPE